MDEQRPEEQRALEQTAEEQRQQQLDLAQELRELARQLMEAIRVAREHPQTKEFERQMTQAVNELSKDIDRAVRSASQEEHVQKAGAQVKQAAQTVKESSAGQDIARGLAKGMHALNEQIRRAVDEAEKQTREAGTTSSPRDQMPPTDAGKE